MMRMPTPAAPAATTIDEDAAAAGFQILIQGCASALEVRGRDKRQQQVDAGSTAWFARDPGVTP